MARFPFDCVLFDLDGTLVATDRFWLPVARAGARRAFQELGLTRDLPTGDQWMSMVGYPIDEGFRRVFADLDPAALAHVRERVREEEQNALRAGGAALLPGVGPALEELARRGVRMGIASNCGAAYLETMMEGLGLARWIETGRCLASPGVRTKADMVADLLVAFGSRSAVMVGDRVGDCEAAHANGIPHVHVANGFAQAGETVRAEAVLEGLDGLIERLEEREAWIARALRALDLDPDGRGGPRVLAVTGPPLAGKTLFARDACRLLRASGRLVRAVRVATADEPPGSLLDPAAASAVDGCDMVLAAEPAEALLAGGARERGLAATRLVSEGIEPFRSGRPGLFGPAPRRSERGPEVLLVEGPGLWHPRIATHLDRVLYLDVPAALALARFAGRLAGLGGTTPDALERFRAGAWADAEALAARHPPGRAEWVLDASNPLGTPGRP